MLETIKHHPDFVGRYNFDVIEPLILDFKVNGSHKAQLYVFSDILQDDIVRQVY
jgi:hypothetical protein